MPTGPLFLGFREPCQGTVNTVETLLYLSGILVEGFEFASQLKSCKLGAHVVELVFYILAQVGDFCALSLKQLLLGLQ
ncbi:MAG: hypothetical protein Q8S48_17600 [Methylococcaceae bacterium]|nr:hypothetical protein [Methylococcaceae bacterium]